MENVDEVFFSLVLFHKLIKSDFSLPGTLDKRKKEIKSLNNERKQ